jgi:serine/threonine protein phosphatase PrpC
MDLSQALQMVSRSDAGMVRSHNEDAVFINAPMGLAILADGMGGYNAGEVASGMATTLLGDRTGKSLRRRPPPHADRSGLRQARTHMSCSMRRDRPRPTPAIYQAAESQPQYAGMGTTLVTALFYDNR